MFIGGGFGGGFLFFGVFTFIFIGILISAVGAVARGLGRIFRSVARNPHSPMHGRVEVACPNRMCGNVNRVPAKFCSRCGRALQPGYDVDRHG